jgi:hypothetical protein
MKKQMIFSVICLVMMVFGQTPITFGQSGGTFEIKQSVISNGGEIRRAVRFRF